MSPQASAVLWGNTLCQQAPPLTNQPILFPSLLDSRCTSSQGKTFLRGLETLSLSHPAWHHYTNDFIRMRKRWQLVVKLWGHQKEGVNSSRIRVPSSTHTLPGSSKRCIPLGWWHRPGRARGTLCISLYSFGLILTCIVFLLKMLFINKKAFLILYLFFCYITDSVWIILFT